MRLKRNSVYYLREHYSTLILFYPKKQFSSTRTENKAFQFFTLNLK